VYAPGRAAAKCPGRERTQARAVRDAIVAERRAGDFAAPGLTDDYNRARSLGAPHLDVAACAGWWVAKEMDDTPRCGRWRLKPFELLRPVLLQPERPLTLGDFLAHPDPSVAAEFRALGPEQRQALVLARIRGAPPERPLALFGEGGYTFADAVREVERGTPLGVRIIEAECKLVGLLLTEALGYGAQAQPPPGLAVEDDLGERE